MLTTIARPFGMLLLWLYDFVGNYGLAVILFALIVKIILLPFQWKSKKGMMRVTRLTPKMKELEKRHEGNQKKYQEEVAKLYKEEKASPMGGCIWTLIPFPIMLALYQAIRFPITVMMGVASELLEEGGAIYELLHSMNFSTTLSSAYEQIAQSQFITEHFGDFSSLSDKLIPLDYSFLGLNLGEVPQWNFFMQNGIWSDASLWGPALGLFFIPVISAGLTVVSTKLSQAMNPTGTKQAEQQQAQMKSMNLVMPLISVFIGFTFPAALGIYWVASSAFSIIQEFILNKIFKKQLDAEDAIRRESERERRAEIERRHQETERLKAEGKTDRNANTSKKKLQAKEKAEYDAVKAAAQREERKKRREQLGITDEDKPDSQSGNRRYARGRAYVSSRYTNPDEAEAATEVAAAESEFGKSIDADEPDDVMQAAADTVNDDARSEDVPETEFADDSAEDIDEAAAEDDEDIDEHEEYEEEKDDE